MKRAFQALFWTLLAAALALSGCSSDNSDSNVQCDSYGRCYDSSTGMAYNDYGYNGLYGDPFYGNGGLGYGRNSIMLSGAIEVITNPSLWRKAQMAIGICSDRVGIIQSGAFSSCMGGNPGIQVTIDDYQFTGSGNTSTGTLAIGMSSLGAYSTPSARVIWAPADGNTSIASRRITTPYDSSNLMQVRILGRITDSIVGVRLYYGNQQIGEGRMCRNGRC